MTAYGDILWRPRADRITASSMEAFRRCIGVASFADLHRWSVTEIGAFWGEVAAFTGVRFSIKAEHAYQAPPDGKVRGARWFEGARLNFAENLLAPGADADVALIALAEGSARREFTRGALRLAVARTAAALKQEGVGVGDRVAGVLVNGPEALIAMLATSSLGAIWSSCSPDFGANAIVDRFKQIDPKVVFMTSSYRYGGKLCDVRGIAKEAVTQLPSVKRMVMVSHLEGDATGDWQAFLGLGTPKLDFVQQAFDAPLFIMFSSGTTGVPKCITHGVGGTLLQIQKELSLHSDIGAGSRLMFYTTCGWMMWNWMVTALATGASLVLFDGAVTHPDLGCLWRTVKDEGVTAFGTSPKFISACMGQGTKPGALLGGHRPRTVLTTGSPLLPEHGAWIYQELGDVHLASISGGTDIISCFMLGTPLLPVRAGEIQYAGLGMAVEAWDDDGLSVRGVKGELVCTAPFPSMPVNFWNDPSGERYRDAYFTHYAQREVWRHGDFIEITEQGGIIVFGRSDATLNPGGVRIGTAELYRQVEAVPEVVDSIAVGRVDGDDTTIVLFVKLQTGLSLDASLTQKIKTAIRSNLTPRHVPRDIVAVTDIPYTRSGKKVEIAVTEAIHGHPVKNLAALANPECMDEFFAMASKPKS